MSNNIQVLKKILLSRLKFHSFSKSLMLLRILLVGSWVRADGAGQVVILCVVRSTINDGGLVVSATLAPNSFP